MASISVSCTQYPPAAEHGVSIHMSLTIPAPTANTLSVVDVHVLVVCVLVVVELRAGEVLSNTELVELVDVVAAGELLEEMEVVVVSVDVMASKMLVD